MKHKKVTNALLKHLGSEKTILHLSKNLQKENQVVFCNNPDVCSLVVSCLAQKARGSLVVVVDSSKDIRRIGFLCRDLLEGDVFFIYKEKNSAAIVPGFSSDSNYEFERSCYSLINNKVLRANVPYKRIEKELKNYTNCVALKNGWCWEIPLWD